MGIMNYGGPGIGLTLRGQITNVISLPAGGIVTIPAGPFSVSPGNYSFVQFLDPISQEWRIHSDTRTADIYVESDGTNWRIANLTGCVVGARLTNAGANYTSVPTITVSAGGAQATAIMGQVVSTTATLTTNNLPSATSGSNYTYPPICIVSPPPTGGLPAKATCALTNGAVSSITITDQGAGYGLGPTAVGASLNAPTITFVTNPEDPNLPENGGTVNIVAATATLALDPNSAGTVNAVIIGAPGTPLTAVPTLTFSSGAAAATAIMAFTVTAQTVSGGSGYPNLSGYTTTGGSLTSATAYLSSFNNFLAIPRPALGTVTASGGVLSSVTIQDGGTFQAVPSPIILQNGTVSTGTIATPTVGGVTDNILMQPV